MLIQYSSFCLLRQVSLVQYSDDAKTEFKLNTYYNKGIVISALKSVRYRGGNTKTGAPPRKKKKTTNHLCRFLKKIGSCQTRLCGLCPSRHCSEARLRESLHLGQRHEEERAEGVGGPHRWTLPGRCEEECGETAALW